MHKRMILGLCGLAASIAFTLTVWGQESGQNQPPSSEEQQQVFNLPDSEFLRQRLLDTYQGVQLHERVGRITKIYGKPFGGGVNPLAAGDRFRRDFAGLFGILPEDLLPEAGFEGGQHLQPIMFENGQAKFTGVNFTQVRDGLPVYRSRLILLVRNQPDYPIVLASADLWNLGAFRVTEDLLGRVNARASIVEARKMMPPGTVFSEAKPIIFAGTDDDVRQPVLALNFIGEGGAMETNDYSRREFVTNAATGEVLYTENLLYDIDVQGTVTGLVTSGYAADVCAPIISQPLPYLRVSLGGTNVWADANGNFMIPNGGTGEVTLNAPLIGQRFVVENQQAGGTSSVTLNVTPPGPASIVHNAANLNEFTRAEVNAYLHSNIARDMVIAANPVFPTIANQTGFPIRVNIANSCNAFYTNSTINFYIAGGACNNTAFGTVVHHEYGHNIVAKAGSGQGAYGEGMSDCIGVIVTDSPLLGVGFQNCGSALRSANNNCQYQSSGCSSCGSAIHTCGTVLSGAVWKLRNNLLATNPGTYLETLRSLTVNSTLLHTGTLVTPQITIDFLTLADDDGDLTNGGPYRTEIANAFAAHSMPAPPLSNLLISYPNGQPSFVTPNGSTTLRIAVAAGAESPAPGATLHVDTGSGFSAIPMTSVGSGAYEANFPSSSCGIFVRYYVSTQSTQGSTVTSPTAAPANYFNVITAAGLGPIVFADNFESNLGWTVTNSPTLTDGQWNRGVPIPWTTCNRGNPNNDADGSGSCYLTDNSAASSCNSDVDGGATTLTSPNMDASTGACVLSYWRWYDNVHPNNANQDDAFLVEISFNGGTNWQVLETVGPTGPETNGGWVFRSFSLNTIPGFVPTSQLRIRFTAQDFDPASVVEAAVDGVSLQRLLCSTTPGDVDGDGQVNVTDLLAVISAWGPCPTPPVACPADVTGDAQVNVSDLLLVIANWS